MHINRRFSLSLSLSLSLSRPKPTGPKAADRRRTNIELSAADYDEAFHYSPKRNYSGAIYEYCQRQNTLPSFPLIPGPIGGERLFTVQLHLNVLRTIGLARTVKAARHRASENMLRSFRACAFVKNLFMSKKVGLACSIRDCVQEADTREHRADVHSNLEDMFTFVFFFFSKMNLVLAPLKIGSVRERSNLFFSFLS